MGGGVQDAHEQSVQTITLWTSFVFSTAVRTNGSSGFRETGLNLLKDSTASRAENA